MVDGKTVAIEPHEIEEFFEDLTPAPRGKVYTEREQALIIEGFRRGVNKDNLAAKLGTNRETMKRWYRQWEKDHPCDRQSTQKELSK